MFWIKWGNRIKKPYLVSWFWLAHPLPQENKISICIIFYYVKFELNKKLKVFIHKVKEIQKSADDIFTNFKEIVEISESSNQFSTPRNNYNKIKKLKEYIQEKLNYIEIEESKIKNTKSSTEPELKIKNTKSFTEPELMVDGIVKKRKSKHKKF